MLQGLAVAGDTSGLLVGFPEGKVGFVVIAVDFPARCGVTVFTAVGADGLVVGVFLLVAAQAGSKLELKGCEGAEEGALSEGLPGCRCGLVAVVSVAVDAGRVLVLALERKIRQPVIEVFDYPAWRAVAVATSSGLKLSIVNVFVAVTAVVSGQVRIDGGFGLDVAFATLHRAV